MSGYTICKKNWKAIRTADSDADARTDQNGRNREETTTNYGLKKPAGNDYYNIEDFNYNADAIDTALEAKMDKTGARLAEILR